MTYEEFQEYVNTCMFETIYHDSEGRGILVIPMLDAYTMVNRAPKQWVGLTEDEKGYSNRNYLEKSAEAWHGGVEWAEAKLKEKNT